MFRWMRTLKINNEEIEEEVEFGNVEEVENEEGGQVEDTWIPPIDPGLAQQIMSFLKGLDGPGMIPPTQVPTNPPVGKIVPK